MALKDARFSHLLAGRLGELSGQVRQPRLASEAAATLAPKRLNVIIPRAEEAVDALGSFLLSQVWGCLPTERGSPVDPPRVDGAWGLWSPTAERALQATRSDGQNPDASYSPFPSPQTADGLGSGTVPADKLKKVAVDSGAPLSGDHSLVIAAIPHVQSRSELRGAQIIGTISSVNRDLRLEQDLWRVPAAKEGLRRSWTRPSHRTPERHGSCGSACQAICPAPKPFRGCRS